MSDLFTVIVFYVVYLSDGWVGILNSKEDLQLMGSSFKGEHQCLKTYEKEVQNKNFNQDRK